MTLFPFGYFRCFSDSYKYWHKLKQCCEMRSMVRPGMSFSMVSYPERSEIIDKYGIVPSSNLDEIKIIQLSSDKPTVQIETNRLNANSSIQVFCCPK